jgi:RND superfamily putative drug exporter
VVLLVLGTTALMLFVAFRSLLVPLKAVLLNSLSVGAAFGVTVLVFQHGLGGGLFGLEGPTEAIFVVVPVLVFATVFGLSMDYEVFSDARQGGIRQDRPQRPRDDGGVVDDGVHHPPAAAIMILVFGAFVSARVLACSSSASVS